MQCDKIFITDILIKSGILANLTSYNEAVPTEQKNPSVGTFFVPHQQGIKNYQPPITAVTSLKNDLPNRTEKTRKRQANHKSEKKKRKNNCFIIKIN